MLKYSFVDYKLALFLIWFLLFKKLYFGPLNFKSYHRKNGVALSMI